MMLKIPKCQISDGKIYKICVNSSCHRYPFICKSCQSNQCEIRHRHEKNTMKIIFWDQLQRNFEELYNKSSRKTMIVDLERELNEFIKEIHHLFKMKIEELQRKTVPNLNSEFNEDKIYKKLITGNYEVLTGKEISEFMILLQKTKKKVTEKQKETPVGTEITRIKNFFIETREKMKTIFISKVQSTREGDHLMEKKLYQEAEKSYGETMKVHGQTAQLHYKKGIAQFKQGKWKPSLVQFNHAIKFNDQIPQYFLYKSIVEANLGNWQSAEQTVNKLLKLQIKDDYFLKKAEYQQKQYKFAQAEITLLQGLKKFPNSSEFKNMLGICYINTMKFGQAEKIYKKLIIDQSKYAKNYYGLALSYSGQFKHKQCLEQLEKAIKIDDKIASFYLIQGNSYKNLKNFEMAKKSYLKVLQLQDKVPLNYFKLAECLLQAKQYQQALEYYQKSISLESKNPQFYQGLAKVHIHLRDTNQALKQLQLAKNFGLSQDACCYLRGKIQYVNKNYKLAQDWLTKAIRIKPDEKKYYIEKYQLLTLFHKKYDQESLKLLEEAIKYNPNDPDLYYKKGKHHDIQKQYRKAEISYRKVIQYRQHLKFYVRLGSSLEAQEKLKEAVQIYSTAIVKYPKATQLYENRINLYIKLGNRNLAEKDRILLNNIKDEKKRIEEDSSENR